MKEKITFWVLRNGELRSKNDEDDGDEEIKNKNNNNNTTTKAIQWGKKKFSLKCDFTPFDFDGTLDSACYVRITFLRSSATDCFLLVVTCKSVIHVISIACCNRVEGERTRDRVRKRTREI